MPMFVRAYRIRRALFTLLALGVCIGLALSSAQPRPQPFDAPGGTTREGPTFASPAVVVVDVATGRLLLGQNAHVKRPPGPLAHMLTALTVVAHADLQDMVRISRRAADQPGVRVGVVRGADLSVHTLLEAFWYMGAADAGRALVDHVAGSDAAFLRQMTDEARRQGALQTQLESSLGQVSAATSTAYDLALLARAVLNHQDLNPLIARKKTEGQWNGDGREIFHVNSFLWRYPGATGVKSGHSDDAGYVAAASARRGERHLVAVVLGAETPELRYRDLVFALDHAFRHYGTLLQNPLTEVLPYDVQPGETLLGISAATGVSVAQIQAWNELDDPNRLSAGTRLWLPTERVSGQNEPDSA